MMIDIYLYVFLLVFCAINLIWNVYLCVLPKKILSELDKIDEEFLQKLEELYDELLEKKQNIESAKDEKKQKISKKLYKTI